MTKPFAYEVQEISKSIAAEEKRTRAALAAIEARKSEILERAYGHYSNRLFALTARAADALERSASELMQAGAPPVKPVMPDAEDAIGAYLDSREKFVTASKAYDERLAAFGRRSFFELLAIDKLARTVRAECIGLGLVCPDFVGLVPEHCRAHTRWATPMQELTASFDRGNPWTITAAEASRFAEALREPMPDLSHSRAQDRAQGPFGYADVSRFRPPTFTDGNFVSARWAAVMREAAASGAKA